MASLYQQLMAAKGAPKADRNPNAMQVQSAPMNLRSAMRKYAEGGNVDPVMPQYPSFERPPMQSGRPDGESYLIGMPDPMPPRNPYDQFKEEMSRPRPPEDTREIYKQISNTPFNPPPSVPQTSYREMPDGSVVEIGYNGDPISGYNQEQLEIHNQVTGRTKPDYTYQYDGNTGRMIKVPVAANPVYEQPYDYEYKPQITPDPVPVAPAYDPGYEFRPMPYPETPAYDPGYEFQPMPYMPPVYEQPVPFVQPSYTPQSSYRQMPDGSVVEIGYDGGPLSEYGLEKLGIHNETIGKTKPDYRYEYDEKLGRVVRVPITADEQSDKNRSGLLKDQQRLMRLVQMLKGK